MIPSLHGVALTVFWSGMTIALYCLARMLYRRWPIAWLSPLAVTPLLVVGLALLLHTSYRDYSHATHWLVLFLGPATVACAIPIFERRALIRRYWPVLTIGVVIGSATAMASAWALASLLSLDGALRLSLLPRSVSTPFAMIVSENIGGVPDLTAVFVILTGVMGTILGETLLKILPFRSAVARGALYGMGAHAAGVAKANRVGDEEGSVAGLVMVLVGLVNVLAAPLLGLWLD